MKNLFVKVLLWYVGCGVHVCACMYVRLCVRTWVCMSQQLQLKCHGVLAPIAGCVNRSFLSRIFATLPVFLLLHCWQHEFVIALQSLWWWWHSVQLMMVRPNPRSCQCHLPVLRRRHPRLKLKLTDSDNELLALLGAVSAEADDEAGAEVVEA
jgi:hypothetical protein